MSVAQPGPPTSEEMEAMYARLLDRLPLDRIAKLTDRQIADLYFHPRDDGGIVRERPPEQVETADRASRIEEDRRALFIAGQAVGIPLDELIRKWESKYPGVPWDAAM